MTPRYASELARSLLALGLECAWLDHGPAVYTEPYDHIRRFVLRDEQRPGYLAIARHSDTKMDDVRLTYDFEHGPAGMAIWVILRCYGTWFATHSRHVEPARPLPTGFAAVVQF